MQNEIKFCLLQISRYLLAKGIEISSGLVLKLNPEVLWMSGWEGNKTANVSS